jgi:hypothetical protein
MDLRAQPLRLYTQFPYKPKNHHQVASVLDKRSLTRVAFYFLSEIIPVIAGFSRGGFS